MAVDQHIFDVDGDLVLILSHPADANEDLLESISDLVGEVSPPDDEVIDTNTSSDLGADSEGVEFEEPGTEVRMLVSAKHLMLVSPVFRAMLQRDTFKEGGELLSKGKVEIPLPDDDVSAFIIILDIIHCRNRRVPRQISLDMLACIAVLVDKYQLVESVEAYSDGWINDLKPNLPRSYASKDELAVHKWISISWIFELHDIFKSTTRLLELNCYDDIGGVIDQGLPIPDLVINTIKTRREDALSELYAVVGEAVDKCQHDDGLCKRTDGVHYKKACDAMLLGSLLRASRSLGIYPAPNSPYFRVSIAQLVAKLRTIDVVVLCDPINKPPPPLWGFSRPIAHSMDGTYDYEGCTIKELIEKKADIVAARLSGLKLKDLKRQ